MVDTSVLTVDYEPDSESDSESDSEPDLSYTLYDFKDHLFALLYDCINTVKKDHDGVEILIHESCLDDQVPPALTFDMYYNNKYISVDLVPCFKFPYHVKHYKEYIPPAKKRLWEFLNRALSDKSSVLRDGPMETNLEGMSAYLYRDTLKSEMVDHISDPNSSCSTNSCGNGSNITPKDDNQLLGEASSGMINWKNNDRVADNYGEPDIKSRAEGIESEISFEAPKSKKIKLEEQSPEKNTTSEEQ